MRVQESVPSPTLGRRDEARLALMRFTEEGDPYGHLRSSLLRREIGHRSFRFGTDPEFAALRSNSRVEIWNHRRPPSFPSVVEIEGHLMARSTGSISRRTAAEQRAQTTIRRHGGRRTGAGRKPMGERALVSHATRSKLTRHDPTLVTTKLVPGCPNLRNEANAAILQRALDSGAERFGFRLIEYSIQSNHLHLIVEAQDARSLARGMQGLLVRVAKRLNRAWSRRGKVLIDRYHARILRTPREVRAALVYVLQNARKHGARLFGIDAWSSGRWFTGWRDREARGDSALPPRGILALVEWMAARWARAHDRGTGRTAARTPTARASVTAIPRDREVRRLLPHLVPRLPAIPRAGYPA